MKKLLLPALLATCASMAAALHAEASLALSESTKTEKVSQPVEMVDKSTQTPEITTPVVSQPTDMTATSTSQQATPTTVVVSEAPIALPAITEQAAPVAPVESTQPVAHQPVIPTAVQVATPAPEQVTPAQQAEYVTISITKEEADDMVDKTIHELMDLKCKPSASFKVFATGLIGYLENAPAYREVCETLRAVRDEKNAAIIGKKLLSIKAYLPVKTRTFLEKEGPVRCVFILNKRIKK